MDEAYQDLNFPCAGIDTSSPFSRQPARQITEGIWSKTTPEAINVRAFDPLQDRMRGGSRPGLVKYFPAQPDEDWLIQELNVIVTNNAANVS